MEPGERLVIRGRNDRPEWGRLSILHGCLCLAVLLAGTAATAAIYTEYGQPFLTIHTVDDYAADPHNFAVTQNGAGLIYAANHEGLLEFDGIRWRTVPAVAGATSDLRAVGLSADGRLLVGGVGDVGYLQQGDGRPRGVATTLPYDRWEIHWIISQPGRDLFIMRHRILSLPTGAPLDSIRLLHLDFDHFIDAAAEYDGGLLLFQRGLGLRELAGDSLRPFDAPPGVASLRVRAITAVGTDSLLLAGDHGLHLLAGGSLREIGGHAAQIAREKRVTAVRAIQPGLSLLATETGGAVLFDSHGRVVRKLDVRDRLTSDLCERGITFDREGALWVPTANGIGRIETSSPLTRYDRTLGLHGTIRSIVRHHGALYVASEEGLFRLAQPRGPERPSRFVEVPGYEGGSHAAAVADGDLLVAGGDRVTVVRANGPDELVCRVTDPRELLPAADGKRVYLATRTVGIHVLEKVRGNWRDAATLPGREQTGHGWRRQMVEDGDGRLWSFAYHGVECVSGLGARETPSAVFYGNDDGLPGGNLFPFVLAGELFVGSWDGLFRFDEQAGRFLPDNRLPAEPVLHPSLDAYGRLWYNAGYRDAVCAEPEVGDSLDCTRPLARSEVQLFTAFHLDSADSVL
ncbi:MAG: hypothetical protein MAG453_01064 [Calditrichaeota bacterium]|nr:hypothetical protein [Calditrichota bacterium]